jgi:hypoxanthine phosphoribosyltransferase
LKTREPASVEIFTLLSKPGARKIDIDVKYCGFEVPDAFVVGFGLDCAEKFRELPYVGVLEDETAGGQAYRR